MDCRVEWRALKPPTMALVIGVLVCGAVNASGAERENGLSPDSVRAGMRRVADWQLSHLGEPTTRGGGDIQRVSDTGWIRGVFLTGVMAMARASGDAKYLDVARELGEANGWRPGPRRRHADDLCIAQSYAELFLVEGNRRMIAPSIERLDHWVDEAEKGRDWRRRGERVWCDALFMESPALALMAEATGDRRYLELMHDRWWHAWETLYDREEHLWYRDESYVIEPDGSGPRTRHGHKVFWSRGNGWVLAGLARVLEYLPSDDAMRPRYESLMQEMATKLVELQAEDGLWRVSLADPEEMPGPETSGSSLIAFGLAWGVNNGVLDRQRVWPAVLRAWRGLTRMVMPSGRLGWVQPVDKEPRIAEAMNSGEFAAGAFLLAGEEILEGVGRSALASD